MTMTIAGVGLLLSLLGISLAIHICRNKRLPSWFCDGFICSIYLPILIGVLTVSVGNLVYGLYQLEFRQATLWPQDTLYGVALIAITVLGMCWQPSRWLIFGRPQSTDDALQSALSSVPTALPLAPENGIHRQDKLQSAA